MHGLLLLLRNLLSHTSKVFISLAAALYCSIGFNNESLADDLTDNISVIEKDGIYYISATSDISANEHHVRSVLTDYIHIYRLNDSIIESSVIKQIDSDRVQVETLVQCCVPMFCKDVTRVEEVSEHENGLIQTKIIPDKSDFRSGSATWKIEPKGNITLLTYTANLEPDFFIPPLIGTQIVVRNMRDEFITTFQRIERIASINEAREWDNNFQLSSVVKQPKSPCTILSSNNF